MILSTRAFALLGFTSVLVVLGFARPSIGWIGLGLDGAILALALVDARLARSSAPSVTRELPATVHQGEPVDVTLTLVNRPGRPCRLRLRETLAPELTDDTLDFEMSLPPSSKSRQTYRVVPHWRGDASLARPALRVLGPLSLGWASLPARPEPGSVDRTRVFPRIRFEGRTSLVLRQAQERRVGANPLSSRGISTELYALREYLPGDEYRKIHWKQSARRRRPIVRETTWEQHQHLVVMLDCGRPMASLAGELSKLDHALAAALALMRVAVAQQDSVTLVMFSKEIVKIVRADRRTRSFHGLFQQVYKQPADLDEPDYASVAAWCSRRFPRRSLALVCTSVLDLVGANLLGDALAGLARRHRPLLV
ncbi:MAG: DUF58 domain-containing protein, partial [Acidobacteriota bacterium]|nr:DUF58 domain-containing protein [Acidobacteriota bacterium]